MARAAEEIDSEWLDLIMKKLFKTLESQLQQVAKAKPAPGDAQARAANARTLSSLERTLERLARLERERLTLREKKVAGRDAVAESGDARAALERRLDKLLARVETQRAAGGTE